MYIYIHIHLSIYLSGNLHQHVCAICVCIHVYNTMTTVGLTCDMYTHHIAPAYKMPHVLLVASLPVTLLSFLASLSTKATHAAAHPCVAARPDAEQVQQVYLHTHTNMPHTPTANTPMRSRTPRRRASSSSARLYCLKSIVPSLKSVRASVLVCV